MLAKVRRWGSKIASGRSKETSADETASMIPLLDRRDESSSIAATSSYSLPPSPSIPTSPQGGSMSHITTGRDSLQTGPMPNTTKPKRHHTRSPLSNEEEEAVRRWHLSKSNTLSTKQTGPMPNTTKPKRHHTRSPLSNEEEEAAKRWHLSKSNNTLSTKGSSSRPHRRSSSDVPVYDRPSLARQTGDSPNIRGHSASSRTRSKSLDIGGTSAGPKDRTPTGISANNLARPSTGRMSAPTTAGPAQDDTTSISDGWKRRGKVRDTNTICSVDREVKSRYSTGLMSAVMFTEGPPCIAYCSIPSVCVIDHHTETVRYCGTISQGTRGPVPEEKDQKRDWLSWGFTVTKSLEDLSLPASEEGRDKLCELLVQTMVERLKLVYESRPDDRSLFAEVVAQEGDVQTFKTQYSYIEVSLNGGTPTATVKWLWDSIKQQSGDV